MYGCVLQKLLKYRQTGRLFFPHECSRNLYPTGIILVTGISKCDFFHLLLEPKKKLMFSLTI